MFRMGRHNDRHLRTVMAVLLLVYGAATLLHFAHNAEFLADYPSMPTWLSRPAVYGAWLGITALGVCGYLLLRRGYRVPGLCVIAVYAVQGFDGLAHYMVAPFGHHTAAMHLTIWFEVAAAGLLLAAVTCSMATLR
jgi:hypothetical protein